MGLRKLQFLFLVVVSITLTLNAAGQSYQYFRLGNSNDAQTKPVAGFALMGGGKDLDPAFKWLCERASGGDLLVIRHSGDDAYNPYIKGLCKLNSVSTLVLPDRTAAADPKVVEMVKTSEAIFLSGGDQATYINNWMNTPFNQALNEALARGVPIGGTSAGLAVLGEFIYSAQGDKPDDDDLSSKLAMSNPFSPRVTVRRAFLNIPLLKNTLTDTHFKKRDRMGRSLTFLARIVQDGWSAHPREIAVEEKNAVLLEPSGAATVVGNAAVYFMEATEPPSVCRENQALTFRNIAVRRVAAGGHFDVAHWTGAEGTTYSLSVVEGVIQSTAADNAIY